MLLKCTTLHFAPWHRLDTLLSHLSPHLPKYRVRYTIHRGREGSGTKPEPMWQKLPDLVFHKILDLEENLKLLSHSTLVEKKKKNKNKTLSFDLPVKVEC